MLTLERGNTFALTLYQLAFLLTGDRRWSFDVTREAVDSHYNATTVFSSWMLAWSRKVVIAKALAGIRDDLASSARRTAFRRAEQLAIPSRHFILDPDTTRVQIDKAFDKALLAIDAFPRCTLLLTLFEKLSVEDAAVLLGEGQDLVKKAQIIGLRDLTFNLARMKG
jgi:hypothetical protein